MRKIKRPKLGEYVLVTKYHDRDPYDPWFVGIMNGVTETPKGMLYTVEGCNRLWKHVFRITDEEGAEWLNKWSGKT